MIIENLEATLNPAWFRMAHPGYLTTILLSSATSLGTIPTELRSAMPLGPVHVREPGSRVFAATPTRGKCRPPLPSRPWKYRVQCPCEARQHKALCSLPSCCKLDPDARRFVTTSRRDFRGDAAVTLQTCVRGVIGLNLGGNSCCHDGSVISSLPAGK